MDETAPVAAKPPVPPQPRDPVCGSEVDPAAPPGGKSRLGRFEYAFCGEACRARFEAHPREFLATDPVCGMDVNPHAPRGGSHEHGGATYRFCSERCRERFAAEPERLSSRKGWLAAAAKVPVPAHDALFACLVPQEARARCPARP